jgi:hypothetical protein
MYPELWNCGTPYPSRDGYPFKDEYGNILFGGGKYSRLFSLKNLAFWGFKI